MRICETSITADENTILNRNRVQLASAHSQKCPTRRIRFRILDGKAIPAPPRLP
jgi:hypothetical protein